MACNRDWWQIYFTLLSPFKNERFLTFGGSDFVIKTIYGILGEKIPFSTVGTYLDSTPYKSVHRHKIGLQGSRNYIKTRVNNTE